MTAPSLLSLGERVAKAMAEPYMWVVRTPAALKREPWREFIPAARAAIAAMREPTPEMIEAFWSGLDDHYPTDENIPKCWAAMVDVALSESDDHGIPIFATTEGPKETFQGKRKG